MRCPRCGTTVVIVEVDRPAPTTTGIAPSYTVIEDWIEAVNAYHKRVQELREQREELEK